MPGGVAGQCPDFEPAIGLKRSNHAAALVTGGSENGDRLSVFGGHLTKSFLLGVG
jgi:hypothetical protein